MRGYINVLVGTCVSKQERCIHNQYTEEEVEPIAWFFMNVKHLWYLMQWYVEMQNAFKIHVCIWHLKNSHREAPAEQFVKQGGEHKHTCRSR